jgi:hypothetical protein
LSENEDNFAQLLEHGLSERDEEEDEVKPLEPSRNTILKRQSSRPRQMSGNQETPFVDVYNRDLRDVKQEEKKRIKAQERK